MGFTYISFVAALWGGWEVIFCGADAFGEEHSSCINLFGTQSLEVKDMDLTKP